MSWQSPFRGGGRWCVVVVTLGWYVPRPTTPSRLRRVAAPLPPCLGVSSSRAGRRAGRGRGPPGDGRSPRPIGGPWSSRRRRCRRRERGARARPAPVRTTTGGLEARSASWRRSSARALGRLAFASWHGGRAGRCASGILDARRVWSRAGHVVPVEYLYQVPLQVSSSARPISESVWNRTSLERERKREKRKRTGFKPATTKGEGSKGRSVDRVWAADRLSACGAAPCHPYRIASTRRDATRGRISPHPRLRDGSARAAAPPTTTT